MLRVYYLLEGMTIACNHCYGNGHKVNHCPYKSMDIKLNLSNKTKYSPKNLWRELFLCSGIENIPKFDRDRFNESIKKNMNRTLTIEGVKAISREFQKSIDLKLFNDKTFMAHQENIWMDTVSLIYCNKNSIVC